MLCNPSFKARGNIYPSRIVSVSDNTTSDFYVEETLTSALTVAMVGISTETGRDARHDVNDTRAAIDEDVVQVYGPGDVCLLEMAATMSRGNLIKPNITTDGKGVPVDTTTGGGYQFYIAKALQDCNNVGEKIRVLVMFGQVHY